MAFRSERDSMGSIQVPDDAYWGAQTQRSLSNFSIGDERMPLPLIHGYGLIKQAAAEVNERLADLPADKARWIARAAGEVARGELDSHFPLSVTPDSIWRLTAVRSSLVALAFSLAMCVPVRVLYAQPAQGDHGDVEGIMSHTNGWMGGWAG